MDNLVVEADVAFSVEDCEGSIRSSANSVDVNVDSWSDLCTMRRSAGTLGNNVRQVFDWCEANQLSLRILVNNRVVAEGGMKSEESGVQMRFGRHWRIRPFNVLNVLFKR